MSLSDKDAPTLNRSRLRLLGKMRPRGKQCLRGGDSATPDRAEAAFAIRAGLRAMLGCVSRDATNRLAESRKPPC
jgi:hypothetical protein